MQNEFRGDQAHSYSGTETKLTLSDELKAKVDVVESSFEDKELLNRFYTLLLQEYKKTGELDENFTLEQVLEISDGNLKEEKFIGHHLVALEEKGTGQIIGGGELHIRKRETFNVAALGLDVVAEEYRGKGLAQFLVGKRLEIAKEKYDCKFATGVIANTNIASLRSTMKSGFEVIYDSSKEGLEDIYGSGNYYLVKDLSTPDTSTEQQNYEIEEIPLANNEAIVEKLKDGFKGYDLGKNGDGKYVTMKLRKAEITDEPE